MNDPGIVETVDCGRSLSTSGARVPATRSSS